MHNELYFAQLIERLAKAKGWSDSYASLKVAGSWDTIRRLRLGGALTLRRAAGILQRLSDHWPHDLPWPTDIPRPDPAPDSPAMKPAKEAAAGRPEITDPVAAVKTLMDQRRNEQMTDPVDWELVDELKARAMEIAMALGPDGTISCPEALCLVIGTPRHTLDDVIRRYGNGRRGLKSPRANTDAHRAWRALMHSGDARFRSKRGAAA